MFAGGRGLSLIYILERLLAFCSFRV
jgi:hypothetical protein